MCFVLPNFSLTSLSKGLAFCEELPPLEKVGVHRCIRTSRTIRICGTTAMSSLSKEAVTMHVQEANAIDSGELLSRCLGRIELMERLLERFLGASEVELQSIHNALKIKTSTSWQS